jgi:hypothetical protein
MIFFSTGRHLLCVSFLTGLKLISTALTTQHYRKYLYYLKHKNATSLQPKVFLTGLPRFLVTSKWLSAFQSAKPWQGQLQSLCHHLYVYQENLHAPWAIYTWSYTSNFSRFLAKQNVQIVCHIHVLFYHKYVYTLCAFLPFSLTYLLIGILSLSDPMFAISSVFPCPLWATYTLYFTSSIHGIIQNHENHPNSKQQCSSSK